MAKTNKLHALLPLAHKPHHTRPLRPLNPKININLPMQLIYRSEDPWKFVPEVDLIAQGFPGRDIDSQCI